MRTHIIGRLHFKHGQRIRRELVREIERSCAARIEECNYRYTEIDGDDAEMQGRVLLKDGRLFSFFAVFSPDDGVDVLWYQLEGTQISL